MSTVDLSKIFTVFAKKLKKLSDEQMLYLEKGQFQFNFPDKTNDTGKKTPTKGVNKPSINIDNIVLALKSSDSCDKSKKILISNKLKKVNLVEIAKNLYIKLKSTVTNDQIIDIIVNKTVGLKLTNRVFDNTKPISGNE
jgi:hypothetical protein